MINRPGRISKRGASRRSNFVEITFACTGRAGGGLLVCVSLLESHLKGASTLPLIHQDWMTLRVIRPSLFLISFHLIVSPYIVIIPFVCVCVCVCVCVFVCLFCTLVGRGGFILSLHLTADDDPVFFFFFFIFFSLRICG